MIINIQPISVLNKIANRINIYTLPYQLDGKGTTLYYELLTDSIRLLDGNIEISSEEISEWGLDDDYIINLALSKLNITRI